MLIQAEQLEATPAIVCRRTWLHTTGASILGAVGCFSSIAMDGGMQMGPSVPSEETCSSRKGASLCTRDIRPETRGRRNKKQETDPRSQRVNDPGAACRSPSDYDRQLPSPNNDPSQPTRQRRQTSLLVSRGSDPTFCNQ